MKGCKVKGPDDLANTGNNSIPPFIEHIQNRFCLQVYTHPGEKEVLCSRMHMRIRKLLSLSGFPLFLLALVIVMLCLGDSVIDLFRRPDVFRARIIEAGVTGPILFVGLQFVQVLFFFLPGGGPQIAGGYLFGVFFGTLLSIVGILAGSAVNFLLGRFLGRAFVQGIIGKERTERFEELVTTDRGQTVLFLLFLVPGFPKDALCFLGGLSRIRLLPFLLISMLGRFPFILGSSLLGSAIAGENWILFVVVSTIIVIVSGLAVIYKNKIHAWVRKMK